MDTKDSLLGVIRTLYRWRRPIFTVTGVAAVGTVLISLLLPNYYQATTSFLAASPDQAKPEFLLGELQVEPEYYGNNNDIDRLLTLAESNELKDFMVDSFSLYEHYDINPDLPKAPHRVRSRFNKLYEVEKTKLGALELSVEDVDPVLASRMANAARDQIDRLAQAIIKKNQEKKLNSLAGSIGRRTEIQKTLSDSLVRTRKTFEIFDVDLQTRSLTEKLSDAQATLVRGEGKLEEYRNYDSRRYRDSIVQLEVLTEGLRREVDTLSNKIEQLNEGAVIVQELEDQYYRGLSQLGSDKERIKRIRGALETDIPAVFLLESAEVPIVKSRPHRSIIVIATTLVAFLLSVIGVLLFDTYRHVKWRDILDANEPTANSKK